MGRTSHRGHPTCRYVTAEVERLSWEHYDSLGELTVRDARYLLTLSTGGQRRALSAWYGELGAKVGRREWDRLRPIFDAAQAASITSGESLANHIPLRFLEERYPPRRGVAPPS